jgi:F420-0:gamma-glutamyl ligase
MEEKILREYEEEDTVVLEGWVLSKMEGRIIALAWMFQGN